MLISKRMDFECGFGVLFLSNSDQGKQGYQTLSNANF